MWNRHSYLWWHRRAPAPHSGFRLSAWNRHSCLCSCLSLYTCASSYFPFDEGHFEDFIVLYRPVSEISVLAEQFAVVRGDGDVGIFRDHIKQFFDYRIEILHGIDLALAERAELSVVKHFGVGRTQPSTYNGLVQIFEHSVHAADARPLVRRLIRQ